MKKPSAPIAAWIGATHLSQNYLQLVLGGLVALGGALVVAQHPGPTLLALIPNPMTGRLAFVFCGMVMFGVGWILHRASRRQPVGSSADVGRASEGAGVTESSTGSARIAP